MREIVEHESKTMSHNRQDEEWDYLMRKNENNRKEALDADVTGKIIKELNNPSQGIHTVSGSGFTGCARSGTGIGNN